MVVEITPEEEVSEVAEAVAVPHLQHSNKGVERCVKTNTDRTSEEGCEEERDDPHSCRLRCGS